MYVSHILYLYSYVDGHFGCFHVFAIVKRVAVNIGEDVSFRFMLSSRYAHRSELAGSSGSSILFYFTSFHFNFNFFGIELIYNVVLLSAAQHSEAVIHISNPFWIPFPYRSLQSIE